MVLLEKCILGTCQAGRQPIYAEANITSEPACACVHENDIGHALGIKELKKKGSNIEDVGSLTRRNSRRSHAFEPLSKDTNFTDVPPSTDITPRLLNQPLTVQPQDTATVMPINLYFRRGHISFGVQLNGIVASTFELNASTSSIQLRACPPPCIRSRPALRSEMLASEVRALVARALPEEL